MGNINNNLTQLLGSPILPIESNSPSEKPTTKKNAHKSALKCYANSFNSPSTNFNFPSSEKVPNLK